MNKTGHR
jgi:hypothetical protein